MLDEQVLKNNDLKEIQGGRRITKKKVGKGIAWADIAEDFGNGYKRGLSHKFHYGSL